MRTKTTLAAAAILAAGLASSMAQNVYSLNVVGYTVNTMGGTFTALSNPLRAAAGTPEQDRLDKVIPYADGDNVLIWSGSSWASWTMDSASTTGWVNPAGGDAPLASLPVVGPGKGFFYGNNIGTPSVTFVGEVRLGTTVVNLPVGLTATGSPLPYGGAVSTGPINLQVQDGDAIQKWGGSSWLTYTRDSAEPTGWTGPTGAGSPEPTLTIAEGFFYANGVGAFDWTQTLNIP